MPERDPQHMSEGARCERDHDLRWLNNNLPFFWWAAQTGFQLAGRGAVVTDTTTRIPSPLAEHHAVAYLPLAELEKHALPNALSMVQAHEPSWEFIAVLLKTGNQESSYRLRIPSVRQRTKIT